MLVCIFMYIYIRGWGRGKGGWCVTFETRTAFRRDKTVSPAHNQLNIYLREQFATYNSEFVIRPQCTTYTNLCLSFFSKTADRLKGWQHGRCMSARCKDATCRTSTSSTHIVLVAAWRRCVVNTRHEMHSSCSSSWCLREEHQARNRQPV